MYLIIDAFNEFELEDPQSCRSSLLFACVRGWFLYTHMPNNSKHVKDISIISGSKIHMEQDDPIYYHAQSFHGLSRFWFTETILIWW